MRLGGPFLVHRSAIIIFQRRVAMHRSEKTARLKTMLRQVAPDSDLESLARKHVPRTEEGHEADAEEVKAEIGLQKLAHDRDEEVADDELRGLEAIVMPRERPVVFIRNGSYDPVSDPWTHLNADAVRQRLEPLLASVGRVELPNSPWIPYGGTGFVVGPNLLMTNRHVARLFAEGVGGRGLVFRSASAAVDFKREVETPEEDRSAFVVVRQVVMVHPYWDMALLQLDGLPPAHRPLTLATRPPEEFVGRDVVAVGYPARDDRNDLALQDRIFRRIYNVKRFQPGKVRQREYVRSFDNTVPAMTHDSSTLGGNSGSAVLDVQTGEIVGLHFAGVYLKANYAVPAHELARDARVVDAGVRFAGRVPPGEDLASVWRRLEAEERGPPAPPARPGPSPAQVTGGQTAWTIPIHVTVSVGQPTSAGATEGGLGFAGAAVEAPRMQVPIIYEDLESREGYQPDFLDLDGGEQVPLPQLTAAGRAAAAKLDDGSTELKYHKFSVVIHKRRRLALFTAANVDWRPASRLVNGRRPTRRELTGLAEGTAERWVTDPRIPEAHQLPDVFFTKDEGAFDKGHLVRRDDVCWGSSFEDIQMANGDTYHTTNCSPQVGGFNRSAGGDDNWGDLENLVQKETRAEKVCVFSGPFLADDDLFFHGRDLHGRASVQIPRRYWKVIVAEGGAGPQAFGFVLEQDLSDVPLHEEFAVPARWKRYMQSIADIEGSLNGLVKLTWFKRYDQFDTEEGRRVARRTIG
jgi:endonuclease G